MPDASSPADRKRDPDTGRFVPSRNDGDERWDRLLAQTADDFDAASALVERVRADRAAGRTLRLGWDELPEEEESAAPARS